MKLNITREDGVYAFIQARFNSQRLPGKILKPLGENTLLGWSVKRAKMIHPNVRVVVLTGDILENSVIIDWCKANHVLYFQGSEDDVLNRFRTAADAFGAKTVIRLTGDNPFFDYTAALALLSVHLTGNAEYSSNKEEVRSQMPVGVGVEIFSADTLVRLDEMNLSDSYREHVNDYILDNPDQFSRCFRLCVSQDFSGFSFTIDTSDDFVRVQEWISDYSDKTDEAEFWRRMSIV